MTNENNTSNTSNPSNTGDSSNASNVSNAGNPSNINDTNNTSDSSAPMKRTVQDSIFTNMFREKKYLCQLVKALHPEMDVTESDIKDETLKCILANGIYNDLGFTVKDKVIIMLEAQSTWTVNILPRMFLYLAETYKNLFQGKNLYSTKPVKMPKAELYVLYTGDKTDVPNKISLIDDFFDGSDTDAPLKATVITELNSHAIIKEYITCAKIFKSQIKKYGYTREAITEALRVCKDKAVLKEYLESRETEVTDMMSFLFDQETVTRNYGNERYNEALQIGEQNGIKKGYERAAAENKRIRERAAAENKRLREIADAEIEQLRKENARLKANMGQV